MTTGRARILLAEDEPAVARPLVTLLAAEGHQVRWVRAMRETRNALSRFAPDILLLDTTLDGGDGLELFQALRFAPDHPRGGVVILAEEGQVRCRERAQQLGPAAVVSKPVDGDHLIAVVDDLLTFIR